MPLDANEIEDQGSSPDLAQDGQATAADATANSSNATGETDDSLLSVVRDVVAESRKEDDQTASPAEEGAEAEGSEPPEGQSPKEDDYTDVPFNQHPRFKALVTEKNRYKAERDGFRQDAERYQNVQSFIDSHGLQAEEAANLLLIGGLMKTNPAEAWRLMKPAVQNLLVAAGEVLPPELQQQVQAGQMSAEAAIEVSRARAALASQQAYARFEQERQQRSAWQSTATAIQTAASEWEAERTRKDPNFGTKLEPLMKEVAYLQLKEGKPNTPDGVRDQLNRAYKALKPPISPAAQQKRPITPIRGGQVAGKTAPTEMSTLEMIRANRRTV